jgi:hypothetical protein
MEKSAKKTIFKDFLKLTQINLSIFSNTCIEYSLLNLAGWQSGYAAACKAVYAGSIPASASILDEDIFINLSIIHQIGIY